MRNKMNLGLLLAAGVGMIIAGIALMWPGETTDSRFSALTFGEVSAQDFAASSYEIMPEMLSVIYRAFAQTGEAEIYDTLAQVSADDALETLYLERVGAMVGGGLSEADQELHAMELEGLSARQNGTAFEMNVKWRVVGTVGHATHLHVRGNTYAADMTVEPVDGAWRMTRFGLTDVDRTDAGVVVAGE